MDISKIQPPNITLPHIGEVKLRIFSINSINWISEGPSDPYDFLKAYISEFAKNPDDTDVETQELTNPELDDIASALAAQINTEQNERQPKEYISDNPIKAQEFKVILEKRTEDLNARLTTAVQKAVKTLGPLKGINEVLNSIKTPRMKIQAALQSPGMIALMKSRDIIRPKYFDQMANIANTRNAILSGYNLDRTTLTFNKDVASIAALISPHRETLEIVARISKNLRISQQIVSAQASFKAKNPTLFDKVYLRQNLNLPGFEMTAHAGLTGMASKALSSEVLSRYTDDDAPESEPLTDTINTIQRFDILGKEDLESLKTLAQSAPDILTSNKHPNASIHIQFLALLVAIFSLYLTLMDDGSEVIQAEMSELKRVLVENQIERKRENDKYKHERILTSRYHLREGPNVETTSITVLNKDRIVIVLNTDGNWAYVQVVPYGAEPQLEGWIYRYGLKPL